MTAPDTSTGQRLPDSSICPGCGAGLRCGMVTGDSKCWCFEMPHTIPVPPVDNSAKAGCLCPACLQKLIDSKQ